MSPCLVSFIASNILTPPVRLTAIDALQLSAATAIKLAKHYTAADNTGKHRKNKRVYDFYTYLITPNKADISLHWL